MQYQSKALICLAMFTVSMLNSNKIYYQPLRPVSFTWHSNPQAPLSLSLSIFVEAENKVRTNPIPSLSSPPSTLASSLTSPDRCPLRRSTSSLPRRRLRCSGDRAPPARSCSIVGGLVPRARGGSVFCLKRTGGCAERGRRGWFWWPNVQLRRPASSCICGAAVKPERRALLVGSCTSGDQWRWALVALEFASNLALDCCCWISSGYARGDFVCKCSLLYELLHY